MAEETPSTHHYQLKELVAFSKAVFLHFDVPEDDAALAADVLGSSDLRGIDSHGVARLHTYFDMLSMGRINPRPQLKIVRETATTASIDGDNGLGLVVGPKANEIAIKKAQEVGSGWVSVSNTNHFGIAGYYVLQALQRDLIGWAMTNTTKLVAPFGGAERMLGTNPLAIAFPAEKENPIVIDMSTSAAAYGKVEIARRNQESISEGWSIDKDGNPTTSPDAMIEGGALLPLGSTEELAGHKGYALSAMVDILSCVLSGANWGPFAPPFALRQEIPKGSVGKGIGHFFGAMGIEGFIDKSEFKAQIDSWVKTFRATKPAPGSEGVIIPGEPEAIAEKERAVSGIPVGDRVIEDLLDISNQTGIAFPDPI